MITDSFDANSSHSKVGVVCESPMTPDRLGPTHSVVLILPLSSAALPPGSLSNP